jgi:hypothetical protein
MELRVPPRWHRRFTAWRVEGDAPDGDSLPIQATSLLVRGVAFTHPKVVGQRRYRPIAP